MAEPPPLPPAPKPMQDNAGVRMLLPVGRSGLAIAAGYLGLISVLLVPAPFALLLGILAVVDIHKSRGTGNRKYGMGRAVFAIIMGTICSVLLVPVIIALIYKPR